MRIYLILLLLFFTTGCFSDHSTDVKPDKTPVVLSDSDKTPSREPTKIVFENNGGEREPEVQLSSCEKNLKNLGKALQAFSLDNEGKYPDTIEELKENYIESIPLCPACGKPYIYEKVDNELHFILKCGEENAHIETGEVSSGHYPVYTVSYGLLLKGEIPGVSDVIDIKDTGPLECLIENYRSIIDRDFEKSYNLRSDKWKKENPYEDYRKNWETNVTIELMEKEILSQGDEKGEIKIKLYSEDRDPVSGEITKGHYKGIANMVKEKGEWKIDTIKVIKED